MPLAPDKNRHVMEVSADGSAWQLLYSTPWVKNGDPTINPTTYESFSGIEEGVYSEYSAATAPYVEAHLHGQNENNRYGSIRPWNPTPPPGGRNQGEYEIQPVSEGAFTLRTGSQP